MMPVKATHDWIFLFLYNNIVMSDNTGIAIIMIEKGNDFSKSSKPCSPVSFMIPLKVIFITDPDLSTKVKKLPLRNITESRIVNEQYND